MSGRAKTVSAVTAQWLGTGHSWVAANARCDGKDLAGGSLISVLSLWFQVRAPRGRFSRLHVPALMGSLSARSSFSIRTATLHWPSTRANSSSCGDISATFVI